MVSAYLPSPRNPYLPSSGTESRTIPRDCTLITGIFSSESSGNYANIWNNEHFNHNVLSIALSKMQTYGTMNISITMYCRLHYRTMRNCYHYAFRGVGEPGFFSQARIFCSIIFRYHGSEIFFKP